MGGQRNSFALNVAGQRIHYNHYSLDGVENTDLNFNSYMLLPSVDALQEFKVEAGLFDAEYGRAIAQINVSTKSGTNRFHATVFEFVRNSSLDAKNYFDRDDRPIPPFRRNQYGLTVDGPVVVPKLLDGKNRLFFLFNWEGLREHKSLTSSPVGAADGLAHGRLLSAARRQRQPHPNLRSGDARLRRRRQRHSGSDARSQATASPRIASTRSRGNCWPSIRCRCRNRPAPTTSTTKPGRSTPISSPIDSTSSKATTRAGSSVTASRTSSATIRSRSRTWASTPTRTCTSCVLANTRTFGSNKVNDVRVGLRISEERAHLAAREQRQRGQGARDQPAERQPALLGCAEHRHHRALGTRGRERRALHQRRQDDPGRRQLLVDRRQARLQVRRRGASRALRSDRRRRHARPVRLRRTLHAESARCPRPQRGGAAMADFLLGTFNRSEGQVGAPIANFRSNYFALYFQDSWKLTQHSDASTTACAGSTTSRSTTRMTRSSTSTSSGTTLPSRSSCAPARAIRMRETRPSGSPRTCSTCATDVSAAAPTRATSTTSLRGSGSPGPSRRRRSFAAAAASTTSATLATRSSTPSGTRHSPSVATSRPRASGPI